MKNTAVLISYSCAMEVMESDIKTAVFFIGIESVWTDEEIESFASMKQSLDSWYFLITDLLEPHHNIH